MYFVTIFFCTHAAVTANSSQEKKKEYRQPAYSSVFRSKTLKSAMYLIEICNLFPQVQYNANTCETKIGGPNLD